MGYGTSANYADVVQASFVKKMCPQEYKAFLKALKDEGVTLEDFASEVSHEAEGESAIVFALWEILQSQFTKYTMIHSGASNGLTLHLGFHDKDSNGDKYDDVDGAFFWVGEAYVLTPVAKHFQKQIDRKFYVTGG